MVVICDMGSFRDFPDLIFKNSAQLAGKGPLDSLFSHLWVTLCPRRTKTSLIFDDLALYCKAWLYPEELFALVESGVETCDKVKS